MSETCFDALKVVNKEIRSNTKKTMGRFVLLIVMPVLCKEQICKSALFVVPDDLYCVSSFKRFVFAHYRRGFPHYLVSLSG